MRITVFTPTYNRGYIIEKLYRSLQRQTFHDFEWLIIDDGSSDNTEEIVKGWQEDPNAFMIRYYKKENGGKCSAINYGVDLAQGDLFFNVDSDDYLTDDALEKVDVWEKGLPKDSLEKYCGVIGNLGTSETETPNKPLNAPYRDISLLERYSDASDDHLDGERAWVFYTDIQKKYKYPIFENETFMTEAVAWNRMAHDGYLMRAFDDIIWVYQYQPDGLTSGVIQRYLDNPKGHGLWLRERAEFVGLSLTKRLKMYYSYYCDHKGRLSSREMASNIGTSTVIMYALKLLNKIYHMFGRSK